MSEDDFKESMNWRKILLLGLFWLGSWQPAAAVVVEDLFTVELPVADQTTSLRLESFSSLQTSHH